MSNKSSKKVRADELLLKQGFCETRSRAAAWIMSGDVELWSEQRGTWQKVKKAGDFLDPESRLRCLSQLGPQYVSRGALKLKKAFEVWPDTVVKDAIALDIGSSTGGFTQVLLELGAARVAALDVGTHQLHEKLRSDKRVLILEQTHILKVDEEFWTQQAVALPFDLMVSDLSFISLTRVIPHVTAWLKPSGRWILLVKPQFELEASKLRKGLVREESHRLEAIDRVLGCVTEQACYTVLGIEQSPIEGAKGNKEYLLCIEKI